MSDGDPRDQFPIVLERRHIEALLSPSSVPSRRRREARQLLSGLLASPPVTNPREAGGLMIDVAGDPHAQHGVLFDTRRAVLPEEIEAAIAHASRQGKPVDMVALTITGRINRPPDLAGELAAERVSHLNLMEWDTAADIIVELQALAGRSGFDLVPLLEQKWSAAEAQGWTKSRGGSRE